MKDFTLNSLEYLLATLKSQGFFFYTISDYSEELIPTTRALMLRHDVENRYENALRFAQIEHGMGIKGTYYFRFAEHSFNASAIQKIAELGHEIGYHYDDLSSCKGNYQDAIKRFEIHLQLLKNIAPVKTICMEGDPLSKYDNRDLWKQYDYRNYGITTEPYMDLDFNKIHYLTETGRRWDGNKYSVRDKVHNGNNHTQKIDLNGIQISSRANSKLTDCYHSTFDIIKAVENGNFPNQAMLTFHPQRWNDNLIKWTTEMVLQNIKNQLKYLLIRARN